MKKITKNIALVVFFFVAFSCTDEALEVESTQELASTYYKTNEQITMAINAAYDPMGWAWRQLTWGGSHKTWGNFTSDDAYPGGNDENDQPTYQDAGIYDVSPADPGKNLETFWSAHFMGNFRANLIIGNIDPDTDSDIQKSALAQAYFLKGFYYFHLTRMFGGMPIVDDIPLPDDIIPRSSVDESYTYAEEMLIKCIESGAMQERKNSTDPANGWATLASAKAMLGKVYMYHKKYDEAIAVLEEVAADPNYQLEPAFWKINRGYNRHGIESIFEINFASAIGAGNEGNSDIYLMGPRGSVTFNDTLTSGWGFNQPTQNLVDAFNEAGDDVRLHATVFFNDTLQAWYDKAVGEHKPITWTNSIDGYWDRKHFPDPNLTVGGAHFRFSNPDILLRLADVYLLLAEAYVRTGDNAGALNYINKVRERAQLPALSAVTLADVKKERRLELALEGERYFDLVRWNGDADKIDADNVLGPLGYANGRPGTSTNGLFPIPQVEINSTYGDNKLIQNEGY